LGVLTEDLGEAAPALVADLPFVLEAVCGTPAVGDEVADRVPATAVVLAAVLAALEVALSDELASLDGATGSVMVGLGPRAGGVGTIVVPLI
jgi:hypothetical protein